MKFTTSRVVALLTPLFGAVAALVSAELAKVGISGITPAELTVVESVAFTSGTAAALKWLHGLSQWERSEQDIEHDIARVEAYNKSDEPIVSALAPVEQQVESGVESDVSKAATTAVEDAAKEVEKA